MTTSEQVLTIANQLANQGKKPTVALIKAKLATPIALPIIISCLKNWQHDPLFTCAASAIENKDDNLNDTSELAQALEQALVPIKAELAEVKMLLKRLTQQSK